MRGDTEYLVGIRGNTDQNNSEYGHFYAVDTLLMDDRQERLNEA